MGKDEKVAALEAENEALAAELGRAQLAIIAVKHPDELKRQMPPGWGSPSIEYIEEVNKVLRDRVCRMTWMSNKLAAEAENVREALNMSMEMLSVAGKSAAYDIEQAKEQDADS